VLKNHFLNTLDNENLSPLSAELSYFVSGQYIPFYAYYTNFFSQLTGINDTSKVAYSTNIYKSDMNNTIAKLSVVSAHPQSPPIQILSNFGLILSRFVMPLSTEKRLLFTSRRFLTR